MPGQRDSIPHILKVAVSLCLVCALLVSASPVLLRPTQTKNRDREMRKNILIAADGMFDPQQHSNADVKRLFATVETRVVDLADSDWYVDSPEGYVQSTATQKSDQSAESKVRQAY